ncbi:MAG TPA: ADP-ribosylglycohydrolase family protein [Sedimentisphaerales bacterium]|nr:ADP-ribosylglycohydrolase family protein [Sedimentisphaerales bacterium]HQI28230.1 ADP-ribosylglycohydrolase family protein [Sedimentisphaerales bacterium]
MGVCLDSKHVIVFAALLVAGFEGSITRADRAISAFELFDRMRGMWLGQLIGNAAGRASEGLYSGSSPNPDQSVPWQIKQVWDADDDTDIEYLALHTLMTHGFDCNSLDITHDWLEHMTGDGIYVANRQSWRLMLDGHTPPDTGSRTYNQHWYSLDAQIGTESLGAISPGMPQVAVGLAGRFGRVTNEGFPVHAAQFYAAMYANAFFEPNVVKLIAKGLEAIPASSRTAAVVRDMRDWYLQDANDGSLDWRTTRRRLYDRYQGAESFGRYYNWVESTINAGATVLALLYGRGDFKQTVQIAVLAGWDCDCNSSTAGGLLGIIHGFSGLPGDLTDPAVCGDVYLNVSRPGLPDPAAALPQADSIRNISLRMLLMARENILRNGGSFTFDVCDLVFRIPELNVVAEPERPDPDGPCGLVGKAIAAGITVTPGASVARHDPTRDRNDLASIIDGVTDNTYNGRRPYYTYVPDANVLSQADWYEVSFSEPVCFEGLVFHEGDVVWSKLNTYYREDKPLGGYFEDLTVQIRRAGQYREPADLQQLVDLDRFQMYQAIGFRFAPTVGDAIRIVGTPGGSKRFTTILELEVEGDLCEDANATTIDVTNQG